jgi:hypothetical protein
LTSAFRDNEICYHDVFSCLPVFRYAAIFGNRGAVWTDGGGKSRDSDTGRSGVPVNLQRLILHVFT